MRYRSSEGGLIPIIVLIILNFLIYLAINIAAFTDMNLIPLLGLSRLTFIREPWTIITCMFTHQDFFHLLFNMITLYFFGNFLNRIVGLKYFLTTYFVGGIISGIFILLLSGSNSITIGASGAIYALGGALAIIAPNTKVFIFPIPVPMPLWVAILIGFVILLPISGVSWQGHLGGLLFGLLIGWWLRTRRRLIIY